MRGFLLGVLIVCGCGSGRSVLLDVSTDLGADSLVCQPGWTVCSGACVDTDTDMAHCGSCEAVCDESRAGGPNPICIGGSCLHSDPCIPPRQICFGACVAPWSDNDNCGACKVTCDVANGFTCIAGQCACVNINRTDCGGVCVDTASDPKHCGSCSSECKPQQLCLAGHCMHDDCAPPFMCCGGSVIDPQSDNNNCGACGTVCDTAKGFACIAGSCECADKTKTDCFGTCVDTQTDPQNCGACGTACKPGETCITGTCPMPCPGTVCGYVCVDTQTDVANCGACGVQCTGGKTCVNGACV